MQKFRNNYENTRFSDNLYLADQDILRAIIDNVKGKIKEGKIYKGKAG